MSTPVRRPSGPALAIAACLLSSVLAFGACARASRGGVAVAIVLDEAYAAARPGLVAALDGEGPGPGSGATIVSLETGAAALVEAAKTRAPAGTWIVASPYLAVGVARAEADLEGGAAGKAPGLAALGGAGLVVPDYRGPDLPYLRAVRSQADPAFRAAGRAAGAAVAALRARGEREATAALAYRPGVGAEETSVGAFVAGFSATAGFAPLVVSLPAYGEAGKDDSPALQVLLENDVRLVLLALGPGLQAALVQLSRPGLVLGAALVNRAEGLAPSLGLAFCLAPDESGLAKALRAAARAGGGSSGAVLVPERLVLLDGPSAGGEAFFERFLRAEAGQAPKME